MKSYVSLTESSNNNKNQFGIGYHVSTSSSAAKLILKWCIDKYGKKYTKSTFNEYQWVIGNTAINYRCGSLNDNNKYIVSISYSDIKDVDIMIPTIKLDCKYLLKYGEATTQYDDIYIIDQNIGDNIVLNENYNPSPLKYEVSKIDWQYDRTYKE